MNEKATKLFEELEKMYSDHVLGGIQFWGEALVKVRGNETAIIWDQLRGMLGMTHRDAEIDAAIAVGEGRLDAGLFPDGVTHSKILALNPDDQARLLSTERFQTYTDSGTGEVVTLKWREMTPIQRNRLISAKGGRILTLAEQAPPRGAQPVKVGLFVTAGYHTGDGYLTLRNGQKEARIALKDLANALDRESFEVFVRDMRNTFGDAAEEEETETAV